MKKFYTTRWFLSAIILIVAMLSIAHATSPKIDVRGDKASYSTDGKRAEFSGNVILTYNGSTINANQLLVEIDKEGNRYTASGNPARALCNDCANQRVRFTANTIIFQDGDAQVVRFVGDINLCASELPNCDNGKISADSIRWQQQGIAEMQGEPAQGYWILSSGTRVEFQANTLSYNNDNGDITMEGDAKLQRGESKITGSNIAFNLKTGALSATGDNSKQVRGVFGGVNVDE